MKQNPIDILSNIAADAAERIVNGLGQENVRSVFASGSFARNEIFWYERGGRVEIYSDLDISVVLPNGSDWETCRKNARSIAGEIPLEGERFALIRPVDVGVYTVDSLLAQPPRPGTVDIADSHKLLFGDAGIPEKMRGLSRSVIDKKEGLYLLENRLIEKSGLFDLVRRHPSTALEGYAIYAALKACMDAGSAILIYLGQYHPDPAVRMQNLNDAAQTPSSKKLFPDGVLDKINGSYEALRDLQQILEAGKNTYQTAWYDVEPVVLSVWFELASGILRINKKNWETLVLARCRRGEFGRNLREFALLAKRRHHNRVWGLLLGSLCMRLSPLESVRMAGLVESVLDVSQAEKQRTGLEKIYLPYIDRVTRFFDHREGGIFHRARTLYEEIN